MEPGTQPLFIFYFCAYEHHSTYTETSPTSVPKAMRLSPDQPPLRTGCKEQLFNNKTPKRLRLAGDPNSQPHCCCSSHHSCSHKDMNRAQKVSSAQLAALLPKQRLLLALQQLCLTQFNSLNQQKTHLETRDGMSFIFNKPRGITEESDKQQSHH